MSNGLLFDVGPEPIDCEGLRVGDCVELLKGVPSGSIDLVVSDPPFNIKYGYDIYKDSLSADAYLAWCGRWGREVVRVLAPDGSFWLAIGDEFAAELKVLFHRELGLHMRSWVVWYVTFGTNCQRKLTRSHTHLFHFVKDPERFTFNAEAVKVPSARASVYRDKRAARGGRLPDDTWVLRPADAEGRAFDADHDVWYHSRVCGTFDERVSCGHPAQQPEALVARIVRMSSHPGDVVLDPFGGSGTTATVAKKLGRRFITFELSPDYAAGIAARLEAVREGDPIAGGKILKPKQARKRKKTKPAKDAKRKSEQPALPIGDPI